MAGLLTEQTAVVTGGASGIGRAISVLFAEHGADVIVADLRNEPREGGVPTHETIRDETDSRSTFVECDVTNISELEDAMDVAVEYGGLDIMVNNAGIVQNVPFTETTEKEFEAVMDVNVKGVFFGAQLSAKQMLEQRNAGSIINISSVSGLLGSRGAVSYCASKGAVRVMTYAIADALGPAGIRVNAIHPGTIETEMTGHDLDALDNEIGEERKEKTPLRRFGRPDEIAGTALYLASEYSSFVTGSSIVVDGGKSTTI